MKILTPKQQLVSIAQAMLEGKVNLLEGCRKICTLQHQTDNPDNPAFRYFIGVDSETDHYPLGEARKWSDPEYIKRVDKEIEEYLSREKELILDACRKLVDEYSE